MGWRGLLAATTGLALAGLVACRPDRPFPVDDASLGIRAVFPGEARMAKYSESTPYGQVDWFSYAYASPGRLDFTCHVDVGNLPRGAQGGTTSAQVAATFEKWLAGRFQGFIRTDLPPSRGPGFRYRAALPSGVSVEGIVVVRRARLHHAQVSSGKAGDPRVGAFLDSFSVR